MRIKITKRLENPTIKENDKLDIPAYTGHFCQPLSRNLYFGLDKMTREEVFGSSFHIGELKPVDKENGIYDFSIDEILRTERKASVGSIISMDEKSRVTLRRAKEALINDYGLLEEEFEFV